MSISAPVAAALQRRGVHYGWVVVATTFLTMLVTAAAMSAPGVLLLPLQREFGWSTAVISSAMALRLVFFGLMGPFAAAFINRYGTRNVILSALLLIAAGLAASLGMRHIWQLVVTWGVLVGLGTGLTALVLAATVSARWFKSRRGLIVGLLTARSATGQLIFLPLLASVATHAGWRAALLLVCGLLAFAALIVWLFMRDRPADVGLDAFDDTVDITENGQSRSVPAPLTPSVALAALTALRDASRVPTFWILFITFFICGASTNGLIQTHFISLCSDKGLEEVAAAGVLATMGVFDFFGTIASGWLSDRYSASRLLFWYYAFRGLSLLYLPFATFSYAGLSLFALFYGLDWIATVPPTVNVTIKAFGQERANLVFGWIFAGHQLGAATAALGAGLSRTELATYLPAFFTAGALCLLAAALALRLSRDAVYSLPAPNGTVRKGD